MEQAVECKSWYAIQTRHHYEKKVATQLEGKGVETYIPLLSEIRRWSDRAKTIETPLFSGYGFVHISPVSVKHPELLRTKGLIGFVTFGGTARPMPSQQIEDLRRLLSEKVPCSLHAFLKVGRRVRIRGGCLDGLEGILAQHEENNLVISVASIERSFSIKIDGYQLEMI
jgi:transcription antitermination factor NusG